MQNDQELLISQVKSQTDILEKAKILEQLIKEYDLRLQDLSNIIGIKPSYICHIRRLTRLPDIVIDGYYSKLISISHLFIISRLKQENLIVRAYEEVLSKNLTVMQTEELIREMLFGVKTTGDYLETEHKDKLLEKIKTLKKNISVKIVQTRIRGRIVLEVKGNPNYTSNILKKIIQQLQSLVVDDHKR